MSAMWNPDDKGMRRQPHPRLAVRHNSFFTIWKQTRVRLSRMREAQKPRSVRESRHKRQRLPAMKPECRLSITTEPKLLGSRDVAGHQKLLQGFRQTWRSQCNIFLTSPSSATRPSRHCPQDQALALALNPRESNLQAWPPRPW
jgi:hypothetical protein